MSVKVLPPDGASAPKMIGRNVARLRKMNGWSQARLAAEMAPALDALSMKPWARQAVHMGEQGQRAWTAIEIATVARLFGVSPGSLFESVDCKTCQGDPPAGFACRECGAT